MYSAQALKIFREMGIAFIVLAIYKGRTSYQFVQSSTRTQAILIENIRRVDRVGSPEKYYPKIEVRTNNGERLQLVLSSPSSEPIFQPGESLEILFHGRLSTQRSEGVRIHSWRALYLSVAMLFILGMGLLGLSYSLTKQNLKHY
jgi:hypothetical protein